MNILLITVQNDFEVIGLKYLHNQLLNHSYNSYLLFLPNCETSESDNIEQIKLFISELTPDIIGFSLMSENFSKTKLITTILKANFPTIPIIWGGIHPSIVPEICLRYADYVCIGEGERTLIDVVKAIQEKKSFKSVPNLCYMENEVLIKNTLYPRIENLDEIFQLTHIPKNCFVLDNKKIIMVGKEVFKKFSRYAGSVYTTMSTRGCPYACTYCCNNYYHKLYGNTIVRRRSALNIINELESAINSNPEIKNIFFYDDCFLARSIEDMETFCKLYMQRIRRPFWIISIPSFVRDEKIKVLKNAGLSRIHLGLQSGSDYILREVYKRKSLKADFLKAAEIINNHKIAACYDVILDSPYENDENRIETIRTLAITPKPFFTNLFSLTFYPGTEIYEKSKNEHPEIIEDYSEKDFREYNNALINDIIIISAYLNVKTIDKIVGMFKRNKESLKLKIFMYIVKILVFTILQPYNYFRLLKRTQNNSLVKTFKEIPIVLKSRVFKIYLDNLMLFLKINDNAKEILRKQGRNYK